MKVLNNILNYIKIHNGTILEHDLTEDIIVSDHKIHVLHATNLQILYTNDKPFDTTVDFIIESDNKLELIEQFHFQTDMTLHLQLHVKQNSEVSRFVDQQSLQEIHVNIHDSVVLDQDSNMTVAYVELANCNVDASCKYHLQQSGSKVTLRLAALSKDAYQKHYTISLLHLAPHTIGTMDNYGVVKDTGSLIIDGIGTIKKGNYQSNSHQTNKIIVFDEGCNAKANPYLYIDEYDVQASHGASVGKIDEDHLYYLQSRGLSKQEAMHLVTFGYFMPVLEYIKNDELKDQFHASLKEKVGL